MNKLEESKSQREGEQSKWFEYVDDLWSEHKLQHLRDVSAPQPLEDIFDPTTGLYGFQVLEEDAPTGNEDIEDLAEEKQEEQRTGQSQFPGQLEVAPTTAGGQS